MKGGRTPVHIMRFAPSDFINDPWVRLALSQNEPELVAFYALFLFHSHLQGGTLPADWRRLAAVLGLRWQLVKRGLEFWSHEDCGLLVVRSGLAWNPRVLRDIAKAIEFTENQAKHGRDGGRGNRKGMQKATLSDTENQPLPMPEPKPMPMPVPLPNGRPNNPLVNRDKLVSEGYAAISEIAKLTGEDGTEILARNSKGKNPGFRGAIRLDTMGDDWLARTVLDLKSELASRKMPPEREGFKYGLPTESPQQAAERRAREERERGSN